MDSTAACGMPTADKFSRSAAGMLHPHHGTTSLHTILPNYATKCPLVIMGCPTLTSKTAPSPSTISTHLIHRFSTEPTHHAKQHPDLSAVFPQFTHWTDRPIDRPTDRWARQQLCSSTHLCSIESDTANSRFRYLQHALTKSSNS